jgi:hypothetical protein
MGEEQRMDFLLVCVGFYVIAGVLTTTYVVIKDFIDQARTAGALYQRNQKSLMDLRSQKDFPDRASELAVADLIHSLEETCKHLCVPRFEVEIESLLLVGGLWPILWLITIHKFHQERIDRILSWWERKRISMLQKVWLYLMGL